MALSRILLAVAALLPCALSYSTPAGAVMLLWWIGFWDLSFVHHWLELELMRLVRFIVKNGSSNFCWMCKSIRVDTSESHGIVTRAHERKKFMHNSTVIVFVCKLEMGVPVKALVLSLLLTSFALNQVYCILSLLIFNMIQKSHSFL